MALSELIGIMLGDGGVTKYQVTVALSSVVDGEFSKYVSRLFEELFGVKPRSYMRTDSNCVVVVVSSAELVDYLMTVGVLKGNKIKQKLDIPEWIKSNHEFAEACVRGIFDTDGCVYEERHRINGKVYSYLRWSLVSASPVLLESVYNILSTMRLQPRFRGKRKVNLERFTDIQQYFKIVGSKNPKHIERFRLFGGVG